MKEGQKGDVQARSDKEQRLTAECLHIQYVNGAAKRPHPHLCLYQQQARETYSTAATSISDLQIGLKTSDLHVIYSQTTIALQRRKRRW